MIENCAFGTHEEKRGVEEKKPFQRQADDCRISKEAAIQPQWARLFGTA
jgi:hypothetical protein